MLLFIWLDFGNPYLHSTVHNTGWSRSEISGYKEGCNSELGTQLSLFYDVIVAALFTAGVVTRAAVTTPSMALTVPSAASATAIASSSPMGGTESTCLSPKIWLSSLLGLASPGSGLPASGSLGSGPATFTITPMKLTMLF
mmetsp:Transcript_13577/g.25445  ORF Transcript_13577/g.25445 Transcript_13577/m.25445 type:complete len:141 (-) Transcript_13577:1738-2160(-)